MSLNNNSVMLPLAMPTQKQLRAATSVIIRDIQREHRETDQCTADRLGISIGTVRNCRNETADLNALTIAKIGAIYGAQSVNPYNALYGATAHHHDVVERDPLPDMAKALATICKMRADGVESPKERLDALPDLKAASAALNSYIASIETLRLVA